MDMYILNLAIIMIILAQDTTVTPKFTNLRNVQNDLISYLCSNNDIIILL